MRVCAWSIQRVTIKILSATLFSTSLSSCELDNIYTYPEGLYELTQVRPIISVIVSNTLATVPIRRTCWLGLRRESNSSLEDERAISAINFGCRVQRGLSRAEALPTTRSTGPGQLSATGMAVTATTEAISTAAAEAAEITGRARARTPVPPEGGANTSKRDEASPESEGAGHDYAIARLKRETAEMVIRPKIREEKNREWRGSSRGAEEECAQRNHTVRHARS